MEFGYSDMFISGQTAMITDGSWNVNKYAEALGADFQIAELPQHVSRGATTHGLAYVIAANSSNTDAAWEFVKFAATKEAQEVTAKSAIPAYEGAADVWKTLYPDQNVEILLESVSYASPNPRYAGKQYCGSTDIDRYYFTTGSMRTRIYRGCWMKHSRK